MSGDGSSFEKAQREANEMGLTEDEERAAKEKLDTTGEPQRDRTGKEDGAS
jgi:hypothetical protein